jgi:hypothetical protein
MATKDKAGIHASLSRSSSTRAASGGAWPGGVWPGGAWPGGVWPGGAWPGGVWPGAPGRANAAAVIARITSASVFPSRLISTAPPWAGVGPERNRITVPIAASRTPNNRPDLGHMP